MATFTALAATGVNSDLLFPGLRGGDNWHTLTDTADTFSIQYDADGNRPGTGLVVTFHGSSFHYGADYMPDGGTVDSITLSSGFLTLGRWNFDTPVGSLEDYLDKNGPTAEIIGALEKFNGNAGDDRLLGHGNQDEFHAGGGNDTIVLSTNNSGSTVDGGAGFDTLELQGANQLNLAKVTSIEAVSFNSLFGASVTFFGSEIGNGGLSSALHVTGDSHANSLEFSPSLAGTSMSIDLSGFTFSNWDTEADSVTINGGALADTLIGSKVSDHINGGLGGDLIRGGLGQDFLTGGADHDIFDFNSVKESKVGSTHRDNIMDFESGTDDIDLRTIDAKKGVHGNQKFDFIGKHGFHDVKGELRYKDLGSKVIVQGDTNGDGKADFEIWVNADALNAHDFLL
ncbi:MAG: hypothetical protein R3D30_04820 [Hyphomicrobiales bacterium]